MLYYVLILSLDCDADRHCSLYDLITFISLLSNFFYFSGLIAIFLYRITDEVSTLADPNPKLGVMTSAESLAGYRLVCSLPSLTCSSLLTD